MEEIAKLLPAKYAAPAALIILIITNLGRVYHAFANGTGLIGAWRALMYGTNAPKDALTPSETANLRSLVIKDVPTGQPIPTPSAPPAVQKANTQ